MKKILMSLALAAVSAMAFAAQPSADDAKALVEQQAKTVFTKLNANQSRYRNDPGAFSDLIKSEVLPYMDFELMSQVVLGRHWRDASAQQKADFTAAFRDLLVRVYSRGWTNYAGTPVEEAIKILSASPLDSSADILTAGLLGEKYIGIVPGGDPAMLQNGDAIQYTGSSMVLEKLIQQFVTQMSAKDDASKSTPQEPNP